MEVRFTEPVIILPHRRRAIYCHSGLPDDLGIQYQSYGEDSIVGEDEYVRLLPGLGHTGSEPFDDTQGWYRSYRGLAGSVRYRARRMNWNPPQHSLFPVALRNAVVTMLLIQRFGDRYGRNASNLWSLPRDVVLSILELMVRTNRQQLLYIVSNERLSRQHFDWFEELETRAPPPARAVNRPRQPSDLSNIHQLMAFLQGHGYFLGGEGDEDDDEVEDVVDDAYEEEEDSDEMEEDDEEDDDYEYEDNGLELMGRGYDDDDNDDDFDNDDLDDDGLGAMDEPDENGNEERAVFGDDYRKGAAAAYAEMEADAMDWQPPGAREYDSRDEDDYDDEVDDLGC